MNFKEIISSKQSLHYAILLVVIAIVYGASLTYDFVWDDNILIVGNKAYESFDIVKIFSSPSNQVEYLPLRDISYALDHLIWGFNPMGFHLTNLIIFFLNTIFIYLTAKELTKLLLKSINQRIEIPVYIVALSTSLFFAIHPLNSEPVNFIMCRNVLLSGVFIFISCYSFLRYLSQNNQKAILFYVIAIVSFLCALLSKATILILPGIFILFVLSFKEKPFNKLLSTIPFIGLAITAFFVFKAVSTSTGMINTDMVIKFGAISFFSRFAVAIQIPFFYLSKIFFPVNLSSEYSEIFLTELSEPIVVVSILFLIIILIVSILLRKKLPVFVLSFVWFIVALFPVLNFFATDPVVADRYVFIALFPVVFCISFLLIAYPHDSKFKVYGMIFTGLLISTLTLITFQRNKVWKSDESLWTNAIEQSADSDKSIRNLMLLYSNKKEYEKIYNFNKKYNKVIVDEPTLNYFKGKHEYEKGNYSDAVIYLEKTALRSMAPLDELFVLAQAYYRSGNQKEAIKTYLEIVKSDQLDLGGFRDLAKKQLSILQLNLSPLIDNYRRAVKEAPTDLNALAQLGIILDENGFYDEAIGTYKKLDSLGGKHWSLYLNMGNIYNKTQEYRLAVQYFEKSLQINDSYADTYNNLGIAWRNLNRNDKAIEYWLTAIKIDPSFKDAIFNLASLYYRMGDKQNSLMYFNLLMKLYPELEVDVKPYLKDLN